MATTVAPGSSATFYVGAYSTITLTASASSTGSLSFAAGAMDNLRSDASFGLTSKVYGPFGAPGTVTISVSSGVVTYDTTYVDPASASSLSENGAYSGPTGKLSKTYTALRRVSEGMGQAFIGLFGDSTTLGAGAGSGAKGLVAAATSSPSAKMAEYLTSVGIPAADNCFFGEGLIQAYQSTNYSAYDTRFAVAGTASYYGNGQQTSLGGIMWQLNASAEGLV